MQTAMLALILAASPLFEQSPEQVTEHLAGLHARVPVFEARLAEIAAALVGTPYKDGPLGEGPGARYDDDPLMDLHCVDCVTFVEQTIALAAAASYDEAFQILQRVRYKDGRVDFETRNHFMESDWLVNNAWCQDVTPTLGVDLEAVTRTISKRDFFGRVNAPELGQTIPDREMTVRYVPLARVPEAMRTLPSPCLICLIGKLDWLFAVHTGLYVKDAGGQAHFYHGSSKAGRVVDDSLAVYLKDSTRHLGFTAHLLSAPPAPRKAD